jgi:hypothetical protein
LGCRPFRQSSRLPITNREPKEVDMAHAQTIRPLNKIFTQASIAQAWSHVDHVFNNAPDRHETIRQNPFTGGDWDPDLDPIEPQKEEAVRAVLARRWHAKYGPPDRDLQPLPLGYNEREALKGGRAPHILAWYARSLDGFDYNVVDHPSFKDYAAGVMASEIAPSFITEDPELQHRFPPRPLPGLRPGLMWLPPEKGDHRMPE